VRVIRDLRREWLEMRILEVVCRACGHRFGSGVPLARPELGVLERVRTLEVCPRCAEPGDYAAADYIDPDTADTAEFRSAAGAGDGGRRAEEGGREPDDAPRRDGGAAHAAT
jgi:hypothetical protein